MNKVFFGMRNPQFYFCCEIMKTSHLHNENIEPPGSLSATVGELDGEIDLQWDAVKGANCYIIELSGNNMNTWEPHDIVSISKHTVTELKPNKKYYFRVAALNGGVQGPWSRPVIKKLEPNK